MTYELHPLCTLFPRLSDSEFSALAEDIRANGLRQPIVLHDGMILDGGNRYRACLEANVKPQFVDFDGGNIVSFVLSANLHRRHLSAGQQAAIVASAQDWAAAQTVGRPKSGNVAGLATVEGRAAESGASERTQRMADKVAKASPELAKKVAHGEVTLPAALKQVEGKSESAKPKVVPIKPDEPDPDDGAPSEEELEEAAIEIRLNQESYDRILASDDKAAALDAEVKRLNALLAVETGQKNRYMNEAAEWKRRAVRAEKQLKRSAA